MLNSGFYAGHFKDSLEQLTFSGRLSSPFPELMLWRVQGRMASLMRVLAQQTCHSNKALLFPRHAQWLTLANASCVSCLLSLSPSSFPFTSPPYLFRHVLFFLFFPFVSHLGHLRSLLLTVCLFTWLPSHPHPNTHVFLSVFSLWSLVSCPTSPWIHLHSFLSPPSSPLIHHYSSSKRFHFMPPPYCVASVSHC